MRAIHPTTGEYYHVYNRGTDKRDIFLDNFDRRRFLVAMEELNQKGSVVNFSRRVLIEAELRSKESRGESAKDASPKLVDIICYCLMPNHFHLIIKQLVDGGVSGFMHKLGTSYTNYFNKKYDRTGVLFQGAYKVKHIQNDSYLLHLSRYIHLNPLELIGHFEYGSIDWHVLERYPWSSLSSYLGSPKKSIVRINDDIVRSQFQVSEYRNFMRSGADDQMLSYLKLD